MVHPSTLVKGTRNGHGGFCTWHSSASCVGVGCPKFQQGRWWYQPPKWDKWDVCAILSENPEAQRRCRGGPVTLDLTTWDFNEAGCHTKCRKLVRQSRRDKEQARAMLHLAFICELCETQLRRGWYFLHTHSRSADVWNQATIVDFMNRFPDTFQTVTDRSLFGPDIPHGLNTLTRRLTNSRFMRQMASPRTQDLTALKRVARYTFKYPRMTCRYPWTQLDNNIEVCW